MIKPSWNLKSKAWKKHINMDVVVGKCHERRKSDEWLEAVKDKENMQWPTSWKLSMEPKGSSMVCCERKGAGRMGEQRYNVPRGV